MEMRPKTTLKLSYLFYLPANNLLGGHSARRSFVCAIQHNCRTHAIYRAVVLGCQVYLLPHVWNSKKPEISKYCELEYPTGRGNIFSVGCWSSCMVSTCVGLSCRELCLELDRLAWLRHTCVSVAIVDSTKYLRHCTPSNYGNVLLPIESAWNQFTVM
jgi:hypothetical protein